MNNKSVKLMGLGLAGILALTSVVAFADGQAQGKNFKKGMLLSSIANDSSQEMTTEKKLSKFKEMLEKQVTDGKITQEQADQLYAKALLMGDFKGMGKGPKRQNLTDEQKAAIKTERLEKLKEKLDAEVAAGTITQDMADKIYAKAESGKFEKPNNNILSDEDKADLKAKMLADLKEKLDAKVAAGTITQEQADKFYLNAEKENCPMFGHMGKGPGPMGDKPDGAEPNGSAGTTDTATDTAL